MTKTQFFTNLVNKLAETAPESITLGDRTFTNEKKAFMCQVTLANGAIMSGALSRLSIEGGYSLRTLVRRGNAQTGPLDVVDQFVSVDDLATLTVPVDTANQTGIVTAAGNTVVASGPNI